MAQTCESPLRYLKNNLLCGREAGVGACPACWRVLFQLSHCAGVGACPALRCASCNCTIRRPPERVREGVTKVQKHEGSVGLLVHDVTSQQLYPRRSCIRCCDPTRLFAKRSARCGLNKESQRSTTSSIPAVPTVPVSLVLGPSRRYEGNASVKRIPSIRGGEGRRSYRWRRNGVQRWGVGIYRRQNGPSPTASRPGPPTPRGV